MRPGVQIKICGLTRQADCLAVNAANADYAGFVFAASRRQVSPADAAVLVQLLAPSIKPVGVFVDTPDEIICQIVSTVGLMVVQLHGTPVPERVGRLRQMLPSGLAIWQRLPVPLEQSNEQILTALSSYVQAFASGPNRPDAFLLDSSRPGQPGGTGQHFDWKITEKIVFPAPLALAGGLAPDNVAEALLSVRPAIVDTSSGVETLGLKDPAKIFQFCAIVHKMNEVINHDEAMA